MTLEGQTRWISGGDVKSFRNVVSVRTRTTVLLVDIRTDVFVPNYGEAKFLADMPCHVCVFHCSA